MDRPTVRRATQADHSIATAALASAFSTDPIMHWLVGARQDMERRLAPMFQRFVGNDLRKDDHLMDIAGDGRAVALWHDVDQWKTPTSELIRSTPAVIRTFGRRLPRALQVFTQIEKHHPEAPHLHLAFIGVHQDHQGKGYGSALLASMTEQCDIQGLPAYLESSNPRNEPLYARYGFESWGPLDLPGDGPPLVAMWRDPR